MPGAAALCRKVNSKLQVMLLVVAKLVAISSPEASESPEDDG